MKGTSSEKVCRHVARNHIFHKIMWKLHFSVFFEQYDCKSKIPFAQQNVCSQGWLSLVFSAIGMTWHSEDDKVPSLPQKLGLQLRRGADTPEINQ